MVNFLTGHDRAAAARRRARRKLERAALPPDRTRAMDIKLLPFTVDSNLRRLLR